MIKYELFTDKIKIVVCDVLNLDADQIAAR